MILVFGTLCLDRVYRISRLPKPGEYVAIDSQETFLGGEAANTATALQAWGASVSLVGNQLGYSEDGRTLMTLLEKSVYRRSFSTSGLPRPPSATST